MASGFLARIGIDFFSTFSPMASMRAVRNSGTRPSQNSSGQDAVWPKPILRPLYTQAREWQTLACSHRGRWFGVNQPKLESLIPPITARSYPLIETKRYALVDGACIYMAIHVAQTLLMPLDVSPERCSILVLTTHEESSPYCNTWIGLVHTN